MSNFVLVRTHRGPWREFIPSQARRYPADRHSAGLYLDALERSMAGRFVDYLGSNDPGRRSIGCLWVTGDGFSFLEYRLPSADRPCFSQVGRWVAAEWVRQSGHELPPVLTPEEDRTLARRTWNNCANWSKLSGSIF
jgi:hypothetical protein